MRVFLAFLILACFALSCTPATPVQPIVNQDREREYPVLGHLKTRDFHVTISSGPNDVVYTVRKHSGEILLKNASMDELVADHPDIQRILDTSYADRNGRVLDARVE
jgi:hypothetical protein